MILKAIDRYISAWLSLIDNVTCIITFGFWGTDLDWKYTCWAIEGVMKKEKEKYEMRNFTKEENDMLQAHRDKTLKKYKLEEV